MSLLLHVNIALLLDGNDEGFSITGLHMLVQWTYLHCKCQ